MIVLWCVGSCKIDTKFEEIESIPVTKYAWPDKKPMTRQDLGFHFTHRRGFNFIQLKTPLDMKIIQLDSYYKQVDYWWFIKFSKWFAELQHENGLRAIDQGENHDCDNFAMLYKSLASVAGYKSGSKFEPACALLVVRQVNSFGGIPGTGGLHMLNMIFTNKGWYIYEPQTGDAVLIQDYPNQEHIQYMIL